jgi:flagellar biosynthesis GTPase FlhF
MSISEYLRGNETRMRQMRQDGETWETIASLVQNETGEEVNLASLRKTYSRLFGGNEAQIEAPVRVEKPVRQRAVEKPADNGKPLEKTDLQVALLAAQKRASEALKDRDSEREAAAKMQAERDRLRLEIDRQKSEIAAASATASSAQSDDMLALKEQMKGLTVELGEARQTIQEWEEWSDQQKQNAPRSRPIWVAASVLIALLIGGAGGYGSRFMAHHEPVKVAAAATIQEVKPTSTETVQQTVEVPEKRSFDRPVGLPPIPPKPSREGALTGQKTISLFD